MLTAIIESQRLTNEAGQQITTFTADQQLYRVMVDITWVYPEMFLKFIPRLGGMHWLMSFVGCVGTLHACFACIIFANLVYACVNSNITSYCLLQKADEPTRRNVFVFHQNYTVILVKAIRNVDWFTVENLI